MNVVKLVDGGSRSLVATNVSRYMGVTQSKVSTVNRLLVISVGVLMLVCGPR